MFDGRRITLFKLLHCINRFTKLCHSSAIQLSETKWGKYKTADKITTSDKKNLNDKMANEENTTTCTLAHWMEYIYIYERREKSIKPSKIK